MVFPIELLPFHEAVDKAHELCQELRRSHFLQLNKTPLECVSLADYGVQVILNQLLSEISPENNVIAEENGADFLQIASYENQNLIVSLTSRVLGKSLTIRQFADWLDYGQDKALSKKTWVIDPIDGTKEYLNSNRYVIGIGLLDNSIPTFSFLSGFSPENETNIYYFTWEDLAYMYDFCDQNMGILKVSDRSIFYAKSFCNERESKVHNIGYIEDHVHSTLSAYISIATGESDVLISRAFKNTSKKIWDHVPGIALLQKAGGIVSDINGQALDFSNGRILSGNKGAILSNGKFHNELITK